MKKRLKKKFSKKGFTLVELMIVVAIIGLLVAIAIPNLLRARMNSNDAAVQGDLRAFSTAAESYRAAQQPTTYGTIANMTGATPAYLDGTWGNAPLIKHGHNLTYTAGAAVNGVISTYTLTADARANEASHSYCIDHTGVLRVSTATTPFAYAGVGAGAGASCGTANAVQS